MRSEIALLNPDEILGRGEYAEKTAEDFLREQQEEKPAAETVSPLESLQPPPPQPEFSYGVFIAGLAVLVMLLGVGYWWWKK